MREYEQLEAFDDWIVTNGFESWTTMEKAVAYRAFLAGIAHVQSQNAAWPQGEQTTHIHKIIENAKQLQADADLLAILCEMLVEAAESDPSGDSSAEKGTRNSEKRT